MYEKFITDEVIADMGDCRLTREQKAALKGALFRQLSSFNIQLKGSIIFDGDWDLSNERYIESYINAKRSRGLSENTIETYECVIEQFLKYFGGSIRDVESEHIMMYLNDRSVNKCTTTTLNNYRLYLSSFFSWLHKNEYIQKNPMDKIESIHTVKRYEKPFTDDELYSIKESITDVRDRAILDMLISSMIRVSELVNLDISDVDFDNCECIVYGKGSKERLVYFDKETRRHLLRYLDSRTDRDQALFVTKINRGCCNGPGRISVDSVQRILKKAEKVSGVPNIHPHRFRRTGATNCLNAGMPIESISQILGHADLNTTRIYATTNSKVVEGHYRRIYN